MNPTVVFFPLNFPFMAQKQQPNPYPSPVSTPGLSSPSDHPIDACRAVSTGNHEGTTAIPTIDYLEGGETDYREVLDLLAPTSVNSPSTVRSKLTSLTLEQCHQLSSDVRDELARRTNEEGVPVLPDREGFAPQRNETRRKLATLPKAQFQNLFGDVHLELGRRCPGPKEDLSVVGLAANGDGLLSSNSRTGKRNSDDRQTTGSASCDRPSDSAYARPYRPSESKNQPKQTGSGTARTGRAKVFRGPVIEDSDSELDNHSSSDSASESPAPLFPVKDEKATQTTDFPSVAPWAIANPKDLTGMIVLERMYPSVGGGYADIYAGTLWKRGVKRKVAVKRIRAHTFNEADQWKIIKRLKKEIRLWSCLRHPNIVPLLGTTAAFGSHSAMVCPWMEEGNLNNYLTDKRPELNLRRRLEILIDVMEGLSYLHAQSIIHGDLTTANIMMDNGKARLTDFGLSNVVAEFRTPSFVSSNVAGAARWAAPELFNFAKDVKIVPEVTRRCDIYSFGSVTLQVISGRIPYEEIGQDFLVLLELLNGIQPSRPTEPLLSNRFWTFIVLCWNQRPKIEAVRELLLGLRDSCSEEDLVANVIDSN